jgi:hypothetical protein
LEKKTATAHYFKQAAEGSSAPVCDVTIKFFLGDVGLPLGHIWAPDECRVVNFVTSQPQKVSSGVTNETRGPENSNRG